MKELGEPALKIMENRTSNMVTKAREVLRKLSMKHIRPSTWGVPYGANIHGVYGATPPELLHQFDLGLLKKTYEMLLAMIKDESEQGGLSYAHRMRILDSRLLAFNIRHCDSDMPRKRFTSGASEFVGFRASEFPPLIWEMLIVLGTGNDTSLLGPPTKKREVVSTLYALMMLRSLLWRDEHAEADLPGVDFSVRV